MFKKKSQKPNINIVSGIGGNDKPVPLDSDTQRRCLNYFIKKKLKGYSFESVYPKFDGPYGQDVSIFDPINDNVTPFMEDNNYRHQKYEFDYNNKDDLGDILAIKKAQIKYIVDFKNKKIKFRLNYALTFWTIHNGNLMIICKQSRKKMEGVYEKGLYKKGKAEIIKVPFLLKYVMKKKDVHCLAPTGHDFFLLKLQSSEDDVPRFYPDRTFLKLNSDCKDLPFDVPISYQKRNGKYRKGFLMLHRGKSLRDYFYINGFHFNENASNFVGLPLKIKFILKILRALKQIHDLNYVHRDVKLDNFTIDMIGSRFENKKVYIIDLEDIKKSGEVDETIFHGSFCYLAPELTCGKIKPSAPGNKFTKKSDIYAMGIMLGIILGLPKYRGGGCADLKIMWELIETEKNCYKILYNDPHGTISNVTFLTHCENYNKKERIKIQECLFGKKALFSSNKYMHNKIYPIIRNMIHKDPQSRPTIDQVIKRFEKIS